MITKIIKRIKLSSIIWILSTLLVCILIFLLFFRSHIKDSGTIIGQDMGTVVGKAVGSAKGLTLGHKDGYEAGKEAGLSSEDTIVELAGSIQESGKLQVLIASGTYSDILSVGDDYAALVSQEYNAVFTVDLRTSDISLEEDGLHIMIDQPVVDFIPIGKLEKVNEYQKNSFLGSAEDGYDALSNSVEQMVLKGEEKLSSDESMMMAAKASAEKQLVQLAEAVMLTDRAVYVWFKD